MKQLTIVHKKSTNNKIVSEIKQELENNRESRGRHLALTCNVFRLLDSDTFYVESQSTNNLYYFVRYEPSFQWCSCMDNSTRHVKCKHIFGIEYSIMKGTLKDIDKLPAEAKRYNGATITVTVSKSSYEEEDYDF
jgi:predicted nucleic acid-binding Zn finger protein